MQKSIAYWRDRIKSRETSKKAREKAKTFPLTSDGNCQMKAKNGTFETKTTKKKKEGMFILVSLSTRNDDDDSVSITESEKDAISDLRNFDEKSD